MGDADINTLTMKQYLALTRGNQAPGVVKPKIRGNVNFEIKRVTHDAVMLRVFPITLTRAAKRWVDKLSPWTINTWDFLKNAFIERYRPPSKMAKQVMRHCTKYGKAITNELDSLGRDMKKLKENVHTIQIEQLAKDYQAKAANEVPDSLVGQCKAIFANNEAPTDEASSKGTTELHGVSFIFDDSVQTLRGSCGELDAQPSPPDEGVDHSTRHLRKSPVLGLTSIAISASCDHTVCSSLLFLLELVLIALRKVMVVELQKLVQENPSIPVLVLYLNYGTPYPAKKIRRISIWTSQENVKAKTGTMAKHAFKSDYDSDNVSYELNKKITIKIGDEFMKILQDNAFNGIDGGDFIDHIVKVLEILEWIKIPNVDKNQLRLYVFPLSLSERAKEWWDNEIKVSAKVNFGNPNELCKSEEFTIIRYSIGIDEEFITLSPETNMLVEMADMTKKAPVGIVENVLVDHSLFMLRIDVFNKEILLGVGEDIIVFDMNGIVHHSVSLVEKVCMINEVSEEKSFNPLVISDDLFSYDSLFLRECNGGDRIHRLDEHRNIKKWECNNDNERRNEKGKEMSFSDLLLIKYGNSIINDAVRARMFTDPIHQEDLILSMKSYFPNSSQENRIKPRPRDYPFMKWLKLKTGHTNVNKIVKNAVLNEWILDCYEDESETSKDPYSRSLEEYTLVFEIEIEQLADEYELGIGKKGYVLDDIWEKCELVHGGTMYSWHDKRFKKEERWESDLDEKYYDPLKTSERGKVQGNDSEGYGHRRKCPKGDVDRVLEELVRVGRRGVSTMIESSSKVERGRCVRVPEVISEGVERSEGQREGGLREGVVRGWAHEGGEVGVDGECVVVWCGGLGMSLLACVGWWAWCEGESDGGSATRGEEVAWAVGMGVCGGRGVWVWGGGRVDGVVGEGACVMSWAAGTCRGRKPRGGALPSCVPLGKE
ncbi:hypothetical protein Tco_0368454 [Tanacetum coccineum]